MNYTSISMIIVSIGILLIGIEILLVIVSGQNTPFGVLGVIVLVLGMVLVEDSREPTMSRIDNEFNIYLQEHPNQSYLNLIGTLNILCQNNDVSLIRCKSRLQHRMEQHFNIGI